MEDSKISEASSRSASRRATLIHLTFVILSLSSPATARQSSTTPRLAVPTQVADRGCCHATRPWLLPQCRPSTHTIFQIHDIRGGSKEEAGEFESEYDVEESSAENEEVEEESDAEEEVDEDADEDTGALSISKTDKDREYDEPLVASPLLNLYASLGVMLLSKRVDLFSPVMVRIARFAFIAYLVVLQAFVLYVRVQAKIANDQTVITLTNPLSSVLQSQLSGGSNNGMVKHLASSFLSSSVTVSEYDIKQAASMQSGLIMNMAFMWFLHFKMEQVQPLLIQAITGLLNLFYSPLFQIYVMGRNLERPFANPAFKKPPPDATGTSSIEDPQAIEASIDDEEEDEGVRQEGSHDQDGEEEEQEEDDSDSEGEVEETEQKGVEGSDEIEVPKMEEASTLSNDEEVGESASVANAGDSSEKEPAIGEQKSVASDAKPSESTGDSSDDSGEDTSDK